MKNSAGHKKNAPGAEKKVREKLPPEKYWDTLVKKVYFVFYSRRMLDNDGFPLWPDWSEQKRGMEARGLKEVLIRLRTLTESKGIEWTEGVAIDTLHNFLQKAYNIPFIKKTMMCCVMNKFKDMIIASEYTPTMVEIVLNIWYQNFPGYTKDQERDKTAAQIIIGFLKQQYLQNNLDFTNQSISQTVATIVKHIKADPWWSTKSLRTVANNLQEFVNKIKANKNGTSTSRAMAKPVPSANNSGRFGKL